MKCPKCGFEAGDAKYCPACGKKLKGSNEKGNTAIASFLGNHKFPIIITCALVAAVAISLSLNQHMESVPVASGSASSTSTSAEASEESSSAESKIMPYMTSGWVPSSATSSASTADSDSSESSDSSTDDTNTFAGIASSQSPADAAESKTDFITSCSTISYKDAARNPQQYIGKAVKFKGKVQQVVDDGGTQSVLMIYVDSDEYGNYQDPLYVTYDRTDTSAPRILEDDIVNVYGTMGDLETYTTVLNASKTIPSLTANYVDVVK